MCFTADTAFSSLDAARCLSPIYHFTVVCSVTWPLNGNEAGSDLALMQTFLLCHVNVPS